eukprot:scaffold43484_cov73-Cyclotella_meneghiniana.AAC.1
MQLSVSSSSLFAALTTSRALFSIGSNSVVAAAVDTAYFGETDLSDAKTASLGEECSFVVSSKLRGYGSDTGILGCTDPKAVCVEDKLSSLGGRCASSAIVSRRLQDTQPCNAKCTGKNACQGLSQDFIDNNIGENSCCGYNACAGITGTYS